MSSAVCFTQALDGLIHCAWGDFAWKGPNVTNHQPEVFGAIIDHRFVGANGGEVEQVLAHASKPGCSVALITYGSGPAVAILATPKENEGAPPRPEQFLWHTLRDGMKEGL